jgi:hypothetical protein
LGSIFGIFVYFIFYKYTKVNTASSDNSINGSTTKNELKSSENIVIQDALSGKKIGTERKEAIINCSGCFDDPFGDTILDKVLITDKPKSKSMIRPYLSRS